MSGKPVRIDATPANPRGEADERAMLAKTVEKDRCYVIDRGYTRFTLWNAIVAAGSSYVCRVPDTFAGVVEHVDELTAADRAAGIQSDEIVRLGDSLAKARRPDHPVRLIRVAVRPHESYRGMKGPRCDGTLRIVYLDGWASIEELEAFIASRR